MQGGKKAGRSWYNLLCKILEDFGCRPCPEEPSLFVCEKEGHTLIVLTSMDDLLCGASHPELFHALCRHFEQIVPVTHKEGEVMQYLNFRIISTEQGVSFDQTKHIKNLLQ
jgi:hypothetical protein